VYYGDDPWPSDEAQGEDHMLHQYEIGHGEFNRDDSDERFLFVWVDAVVHYYD